MAQRYSPLKQAFAAAIWILLLFGISAPPTAQEKPSEEEEFRHPARQNAILRKYFQEQYLEMKRFGPNATSQRRRELPPDAFMDRFIDKRIDHFVEELEKRMNSIEEGLEDVRQTASGMKTSPSEEGRKRNVLKRQLGSLADDLGRLHKTLAILLLELKSKAGLQRTVDSSPANAGFSKEIEYIASQYSRAADQIGNYFLKPSFTVSIHQLKGENLLIQLHRANKMARELRKSL